MASKTKAALLEIPVSYGNVQIGEETCKIAATVLRSKLALGKADTQLCAKRLTGRIVCVPGVDNPEQNQLPGTEEERIVPGIFDVKAIRFNRRYIAFGLTFARADVNLDDLAQFAKGAGKVVVEEIQAIPDKVKPETPAVEE